MLCSGAGRKFSVVLRLARVSFQKTFELLRRVPSIAGLLVNVVLSSNLSLFREMKNSDGKMRDSIPKDALRSPGCFRAGPVTYTLDRMQGLAWAEPHARGFPSILLRSCPR
jgi:hypothetical protein